MSASDLAKKWKEKAAQKRAEREAQTQVVPVYFEGFEGRAHRLHLIDWAQAGKLPQYLSTAMFAAAQGKSTEKKKSDLTPEELESYLRFQAIAFCSMMDEPRFSTEEMRKGRLLADDELDYAEFFLSFPEVVKAALQWQLDGCPDIPVRTENGEMSVGALHSFRDSGGWLAPSQSGYYCEGVWYDTKPSPRAL
ncbi:MAG: hypothetical protein DMF68_13595 [Acidobacteria bacterium]|nr:MAG: hypothetical protein DMF68_13595 [Acidobacteriota bacterium]